MTVGKPTVLAILLSSVISAANLRPQVAVLGRAVPTVANGGGGSPSLLQSADLSCDGVFLTPAIASGATSSTMPVAALRSGSTRTYYEIEGNNGHVIQFAQPTLSSCSTAIGSMSTATAGTDWGAIAVNGSDATPSGSPTHPGFIWGLFGDDTTGHLVQSWAGNYTGIGQGINTFAEASFGASSMTTISCDAIASTPMTVVGTGLLNIPSSFISSYLSAGMRWAVGFGGGLGSIPTGLSLGLSLIAVAPPASNACASGTDYPVGSSRILSQYEGANSTGPNCISGGLGCSASPAPTSPYAQQTAWSHYSTSIYTPYWDPYGGHGWISTAVPVGTWYDDTVKHGVLSAFFMPEGWAVTTVSANGGGSYPNWTATIGSTSMNFSDNMQVGDGIWIATCNAGVDAGCSSGNNDDTSYVRLTAVNTSTGVISYTVQETDFSTGGPTCLPTPSATCGRPLVGGRVWAGGVYAHGSPHVTRGIQLGQIIDPAQYATVVQGGDASLPIYHEEFNLTAIGVQAWGTAIISNASDTGYQGYNRPVSVISDPTNQKIILVFQNAVTTCCWTQQQAVYVFSVSHTP